MHGDRSMNTATSDKPATEGQQVNRRRVAKLLRALAIPIIVFWVLVGVVTNVFVPSLDETTSANAGPLVGRDAPSSQAAVLTRDAFKESNYTSVPVVLLVTKGRKLGDEDHRYYNALVR